MIPPTRTSLIKDDQDENEERPDITRKSASNTASGKGFGRKLSGETNSSAMFGN
jgi:hypothetical protein